MFFARCLSRQKLRPSIFLSGGVRFTAIIGGLLPTCRSCGITLQDRNPGGPGFFRFPEAKPKLEKPENLVFNEFMDKLSPEDRLLLINESAHETSEPEKLDIGKNIKADGIECIRCRDAKNRSKFDWDEFPVKTVDSILSEIPPHANIVYVINALDFPASVNSLVFKYRNPKDITFVVTKSDLLFPTVQLSQRYGAVFFRDYLVKAIGAEESNVFIASGKRDWNVKQLISNLQDESYFIGNVNSGKSTLIKSLIFVSKKDKLDYLSLKEKRQLEKFQDRAINSKLSKRQYKKEIERLEGKIREAQGPGSSYMPGFTRGYIHYELNNKSIVDVPGFGSYEQDHGVYQYLSSRDVRLLSKGENVYKTCLYDAPYITLKPSQVYTVGGLFYLEASVDLMLQIKKCINFDHHVFRSIERAKSSLMNIEDNPAVASKFLLDKLSLDQLSRYVIPPFYGSIDLVIKNIGHINITATGRKVNNKLLAVYLPKGVECFIRRPLIHYIAKSLAGRDKKGNPLRAESWKAKSIKELKRFNPARPFSSALVLSSNSESDFTNVSTMVSRIKGMKATYDNSTQLDDSNKYDFWLSI